ncbi:hypothetical protein [Mycobacterium sp. JS623]|uniref:hypothetical protein n=1 Tax=Mycobacterium sp. JS623 TaxID=212767 RepID=UPI001E623441|nr:hypothetical protein [Mycobacterium sp. JS623]
MSIGRAWADADSDSAEHAPSVTAALQRNTRRLALILTAFRCPACGHDWVLDTDGQAWDLDETDYTDLGSWP